MISNFDQTFVKFCLLTAKLIFLPCNITSVCTVLLPPLFAIEQRRKVKILRRTSVLANCTYDVHLLIGRASCNTVEYFEFFTPKVKSFTYLISTFWFFRVSYLTTRSSYDTMMLLLESKFGF